MSATPSVEIKEADKPFILVIFGTMALIGLVAFGAYTNLLDRMSGFITSFTTIIAGGWAYYFNNKAKS